MPGRSHPAILQTQFSANLEPVKHPLKMFQNLFKISIRLLWRDRFFTFLNVTGLAVGIAAAMLMFLWVQDELTFDQFHTRGQNIYRTLTNWQFGESREWTAATPAPLKEEALASTPGIETMARTRWMGEETFIVGANRVALKTGLIAENGFFDIFDFKFLAGDVHSALAQPGNIVLTESAAIKVFGQVPPLGTPLRHSDQGDYVVSGILEDLPTNSSLQFDCVIPWESNILKFAFNPKTALNWGQINYGTWVLLRPDADPVAVANRLSEVAGQFRSGDDAFYFSLQNLRDIHLYSTFFRWNTGYGSLQTIRTVGIIGLLVLLIACINYVNLTTARARGRAKSVGIRQTIGAGKGHLFSQAMLESAMTIVAALLLSGILLWSALPYFEKFGGKEFTTAQVFSLQTFAIFSITALTAWLLSGLQPALQLTRFKPVTAMRGEIPRAGSNWVRQSLVIGQFVFSIGLGISSLVIFSQLTFAREKSLGFDRSHTFMVFAPDEKAMLLKTALQNQAGIQAVSVCDNPFVDLGSQGSGDSWEGKLPDQSSDLWQINVDSEFPEMFGLQLTEGRWFRPGSTDSLSFIINESAAKMMNLQNPVGKWIEHNGPRGTIVGVAKDFHFQSLHSTIEPMIFSQLPGWFYVLHVKTTGASAQQAIASTQQAFQKLYPDKVFKYDFLDDQYDQLYKSDARVGQLTGLFTGLALFISCLGLFGLAAFAAAQRTKEIGIRKVLGASVFSIAGLLSTDFLKLVGIAIAIASPIAYFFMQQWLAAFAYHIELGWQFFALAGALAIVVTLLTVGWQAGKAAVMDPVNSLRSE